MTRNDVMLVRANDTTTTTSPLTDNIRYDTIRYDMAYFICAQKLTGKLA